MACGTIQWRRPYEKDWSTLQVPKAGLSVKDLVVLLKDTFPSLRIMEKDARGDMVDVGRLCVCEPEEPHPNLRGAARVMPGDAVVVRREKAWTTGFDSLGNPTHGQVVPSAAVDVPECPVWWQGPRAQVADDPDVAPATNLSPADAVPAPREPTPLCIVDSEWITLPVHGGTQCNTWFAHRVQDSPAVFVAVEDSGYGPPIEQLAVAQAEALARARHPQGVDMVHVRLPSTLAVAANRGRKDLCVTFSGREYVPTVPSAGWLVPDATPSLRKELAAYVHAWLRQHGLPPCTAAAPK
jgi:hypothetical protein